MKPRSVTHASFTLERTFKVAPAKVFAAFSDPRQKKKWFGGDEGFEELLNEDDFRVGGRAKNRGRWANGTVSSFDCQYQDIVPDERIIYSYDMHLNDDRISVSLTSVELKADGKGTKLTFTEHGAYLDGWDNPKQRQEGTAWLLDRLGKVLESA